MDKFFYYLQKLFLLILLIFSFTCNNNALVTISGNTMGTTYTIKIHSPNYVDSELLKSDIDQLLDELNNVFSTYLDNSELSVLNNSSNQNNKLSDMLFEVLDKSLYYSLISDGYYDPTVYPIVDLWGFGPTKINKKPSDISINLIKKYVSYEMIKLNDKNNTFQKDNNNIYIDLSSIAKGYAVDILYEYLLKMNFSDFMVDIGGELRCKGNNTDNNWIIGISNPLSNNIYLKTSINNFSIATSGTYNNFTIYDDIEYSHIINPLTGYPITNNILSSTVISEKCIDADALATMLMVIPYREGIDIINDIPNTECLILYENNNKIIEYKSRDFNKYITN